MIHKNYSIKNLRIQNHPNNKHHRANNSIKLVANLSNKNNKHLLRKFLTLLKLIPSRGLPRIQININFKKINKDFNFKDIDKMILPILMKKSSDNLDYGKNNNYFFNKILTIKCLNKYRAKIRKFMEALIQYFNKKLKNFQIDMSAFLIKLTGL